MKIKRLVVDISDKEHRKLKEYAARHDTTLKSIVLHAVALLLQNEEYKKMMQKIEGER